MTTNTDYRDLLADITTAEHAVDTANAEIDKLTRALLAKEQECDALRKVVASYLKAKDAFSQAARDMVTNQQWIEIREALFAEEAKLRTALDAFPDKEPL